MMEVFQATPLPTNAIDKVLAILRHILDGVYSFETSTKIGTIQVDITSTGTLDFVISQQKGGDLVLTFGENKPVCSVKKLFRISGIHCEYIKVDTNNQTITVKTDSSLKTYIEIDLNEIKSKL